MYEEWPFFAATIDLIEMILAKVWGGVGTGGKEAKLSVGLRAVHCPRCLCSH